MLDPRADDDRRAGPPLSGPTPSSTTAVVEEEDPRARASARAPTDPAAIQFETTPKAHPSAVDGGLPQVCGAPDLLFSTTPAAKPGCPWPVPSCMRLNNIGDSPRTGEKKQLSCRSSRRAILPRLSSFITVLETITAASPEARWGPLQPCHALLVCEKHTFGDKGPPQPVATASPRHRKLCCNRLPTNAPKHTGLACTSTGDL